MGHQYHGYVSRNQGVVRKPRPSALHLYSPKAAASRKTNTNSSFCEDRSMISAISGIAFWADAKPRGKKKMKHALGIDTGWW
jgi:hypothetical protein